MNIANAKSISTLLAAMVVGLVCAFADTSEAFLYRAMQVGEMWDANVVYHDGTYYMFHMVGLNQEGWQGRTMCLATSDDAVHWKEVGPVVDGRKRFGVAVFQFDMGGGVVVGPFQMPHASEAIQPVVRVVRTMGKVAAQNRRVTAACVNVVAHQSPAAGLFIVGQRVGDREIGDCPLPAVVTCIHSTKTQTAHKPLIPTSTTRF